MCACSVGPARDGIHGAATGYMVPPCGQMSKVSLIPEWLSRCVVGGGMGVSRPADLTTADKVSHDAINSLFLVMISGFLGLSMLKYV